MNSSNSQHPQDVFRFCPRCGSLDFRMELPNSKKCGACQFHYFFNASGATVALIETPNQELVVVRRAIEPQKGKLDLPGGFINAGETAEDAMIREGGRKELGWQVQRLTYCATVFNTYPFSGFEVNTIDLVFHCEVADTSMLNPMDDINEIQFISSNEIDLDQFAL